MEKPEITTALYQNHLVILIYIGEFSFIILFLIADIHKVRRKQL